MCIDASPFLLYTVGVMDLFGALKKSWYFISVYVIRLFLLCIDESLLFYTVGVMDLLGGTGGLVEFKASLLASRGFAALALAYFGYDDLPSSPSP